MTNDNEDDDLASMWTVKLQGVQRLDPDDPDDDDDDTYMVEFELQSPGSNGTVEIMVGGGLNETHMIAQAREILQAALERWARVMAHAPEGGRIEPKEG